MNNEFEWRNEMRKLNGSMEPARDLWPQIASNLAFQRPGRPRSLRVGMAIAATLVMVCAAGLIAQRTLQRSGQAVTDAVVPRTALEWAQPANPAFASAAQDLDGASVDLQEALEQQPDAVFLVELLNRTNGQRMHLLQESPYSG